MLNFLNCFLNFFFCVLSLFRIRCRTYNKHISCFSRLSVGNGDLNLYTGFDGDGCDLLHDLGRGVKVDHALVDAHLESIPGLGTLSARSLPCGDAQNFGWHANGSLYFQLLLLGSTDQVSADLFQALNVPGGECNADTMDWALIPGRLGSVLVHRLE